jgi:hypothetical protein
MCSNTATASFEARSHGDSGTVINHTTSTREDPELREDHQEMTKATQRTNRHWHNETT